MAQLTPAYRLVMLATWPAVHWWGRMEVSGLEHLPREGPVLIAANHDSYWDPIAVGSAAYGVRQIHALAKSTMWKYPLVRQVLNGMGQIPIKRGQADAAAMERAEEELRGGKCIGIFPEGTRSKGRELRARSGIARLATAVPEAEVVLVSITGTTQLPHFPSNRPQVRLRFFRPSGGGLQPGEDPSAFSARLLAEARAEAPRVRASWRRPRA